jgi:uncharacterized protein (DUF1015 family)
LISPPYDILTEADKQALLKEDDHNIVAIDLPHTPPKSAGPDIAYERAGGAMISWLDVRILAWDPQPAIYAYHQDYSLGGRALRRKKFLVRLRLEPFGSGSVFPHEQTFGGPKEDRLKLTAATRCNVSPIFALYPDPENSVAAVIDAAIKRDPDQVGVLGGVQNKLWAITEQAVIDQVRGMLASKQIFIADGHHRYGTALLYRQQQVESIGEPDEDDPVNFVLAALGGMEDPGATIQPYFRSVVGLAGLTAGALQAALAEAFACSPMTLPSGADDLARLLAAAGPSAFGLYIAESDAGVLLVPKEEDLLARYEPQSGPAYRKLAYAILHRYVIDEVIRARFNGGAEPTVHYHHTMPDAVADARESAGLAALMPATTMGQLREICTAGELMPQKSTYFFPKLATGMVINPLYD